MCFDDLNLDHMGLVLGMNLTHLVNHSQRLLEAISMVLEPTCYAR
jgi:hypothetical protein